VDRTGRFAIASNHRGGSVAVFRACEDGSLKELTAFRKHSGTNADKRRAHGAFLSPDNRFIVVPDRALNSYFLDSDQGSLEEAAPPFVNLHLPPGRGISPFIHRVATGM
jgi:6-phosphogluconolactonase (cycloisomerase 2 family)